MILSPKIMIAASVFTGLFTVALMVFSHESFVAGVFAGLGLAVTAVLVALTFVQRHLEDRVDEAQAQVKGLLGIDLDELLK